ncbi:MAG TPA: metallophosphoesterase, partial [Ruania sp.]|nr:metallophosphoesterase [Ruania sp.]
MSEEEPRRDGRHRVEWWHQLRPMTRRSIRAGLAFLVTGLLAITVGVLTADYSGSLGPNEAEYSVRLNDEIRIDLGPIGALILDSPLPLHLGVNVQVGEIPVELATPESDPIEGLKADLTSYTQFFSDPQPAIREAANGLISDALARSTLFWCVLLMLVACGRLAAHGALRDAVKEAFGRREVAALSVAVAVVVAGVPLTEQMRGSGDVGRTSPVLAGTPLENARITGRLATLVDYYGGMVRDAIQENDEFYAAAKKNLLAAFDADAAGGATSPSSGSGQGSASPGATPTASSGTPQDGETGESESEESEAGEGEKGESQSGEGESGDGEAAEAQQEDETITGVMVTDLHCNIGMAGLIGATVEQSDADLILDGGDTVMAGTSVESYCIRAFDQGFGNLDVPVVFADGNHDSHTTLEQEIDAGWIALQGEPVEVAGLRILGDTDPTLSSLGVPTHQTRDETVLEMGERLATTGCDLKKAGTPVDVLLIHSPYAGRQILEADCAPVSLSGHLHRRVGPRQVGWGTQYISDSTGGAGKGQPTVGPLNNPAAITVIRWDAETKLPIDFRIITVGTDTSVEIGDWTPWPPQP